MLTKKDDLTVWLNKHQSDLNKIKPESSELIKVPEERGIYFWYMHPDGYSKLSKFVTIKRLDTSITKFIDNINYDLVYIGTAGTGKNGNSNLQERLNWHCSQQHSKSNICHGTISTLRLGLSSLLSDDLIQPNTEIALNEFMRNYMYVYWITYDNINSIDNDEFILIQSIKPLLNIKNNPNGSQNTLNKDNSTFIYRKRRNLINKNTKEKICSFRENETQIKNPIVSTNVTDYSEQIISEYNNCIKYTVQKDQDIAQVTRGVRGLEGEVKISIDNNFENEVWKFRTTGNNNDKSAQNIYTYFGNSAPKGLYAKYNCKNRNEIISKWMKGKGIEEITVSVTKIK